MGFFNKKPAEEKTVQEGLPNITKEADDNAVRTSILEDTSYRTDRVLNLENTVPQIGAAQTNFLAQIQSKTPDEKQIKLGTKIIVQDSLDLMKKAADGQKAELDALNGEKKLAAEKWARDQEAVKAEKAKATSDKWLSPIGALGRSGGEALKGLGLGLIGILGGAIPRVYHAWKEEGARHRKEMSKLKN